METLEQALEEERRITRFLKIKLWVDLVAQISLLGLVFYWWGYGPGDTTLMILYFGLGGYQLLSSLLHLTIPHAFKNRKAYYIQLIIHAFIWLHIFVAIHTGILGELVLLSLYIELFLSPLTALYYFIITILDFSKLPKRVY